AAPDRGIDRQSLFKLLHPRRWQGCACRRQRPVAAMALVQWLYECAFRCDSQAGDLKRPLSVADDPAATPATGFFLSSPATNAGPVTRRRLWQWSVFIARSRCGLDG